MPLTQYYESGSWNMACDICGFNFKSSQMRKAWDGSWRDAACFETRQPQDFVRGVRDDPSVPVARPQNIIYLVNSDNIPSPYPLGGDMLDQSVLGGA